MAARGRRLPTWGVLVASAATSVSLAPGPSQAQTLGLQGQIDATPDGGLLELSGEYVTDGIVTIRQVKRSALDIEHAIDISDVALEGNTIEDFGTNGVTVGFD